MTAPTSPPAELPTGPRWTAGRVAIVIVVALMVSMWAYVLYLAFVPGRQPPPLSWRPCPASQTTPMPSSFFALFDDIATLLDAELTTARTGDDPWPSLERAHLLSQPWAWPHTRVHLAMLRLAVRQRDGREVEEVVAGRDAQRPGVDPEAEEEGHPGDHATTPEGRVALGVVPWDGLDERSVEESSQFRDGIRHDE